MWLTLLPGSVILQTLATRLPDEPEDGLGFLAGWVVGIVIAIGVFIALAAVIETLDEPPTWASWTRIGLGVLLLILGLLRWRIRNAQQEIPAWMKSIDGLTPATALRLGLLLSAANPKVLLLAAAAGLAIGSAEMGTAGIIGAAVSFTVIATSTVALPLLLHGIFGDRILMPLGKVRTWLQQNNAVVIIVIGAAVLVKGIRGV